ncbi:hypothetical protein [Streptomyces sp. NRRL F-5123]|uniref:hypothetical protein n=1 Tax=Streptomyces sp. NRRL F-5123 TaxID=1463856 RepID=UPI0004E28498|nr:hypothetical protein [Streptomyces sp. NRRL F-5123]
MHAKDQPEQGGLSRRAAGALRQGGGASPEAAGLQRSVGNTAVTRMIEGGRRGAPVQRVLGGEDTGGQAAAAAAARKFEAAAYVPGAPRTAGTVTPGRRAGALREILWERHWAPISAVCKKSHYTIAVRETGRYSVKRIEEGAKPKPHTILEKSIKPGSVDKSYGTGSGQAPGDPAAVLRWLESEDLDGFVGHWRPGQGLVGVRIDKPPQSVLDLGIVQEGPRGEQYVPITVGVAGGGAALAALKGDPRWRTYLYTGDYDLHEAYRAMGGMAGGGQIAEASREKADLLNRLNAGVAAHSQEQVTRSGRAVRGEHGLHMEDSAYAMFQHGDQATYRMNQYLEARAEQEDALRPVVADLVRAVATESDEPMGWCRFGQWYVTMNRAEHAVLRRAWRLATPNSWSDEAVKRTAEGDYSTARYTS